MKFDVHEDAVADIALIHQDQPSHATKILAFIEELENSPDLLDSMTIQNYGDDRQDPIFVKKWGSVYRGEKMNVWRLRSMELEQQGLNYRFIYCYYYKDQTHHLVAVVAKKDMDYDSINDPIRTRVVSTCRRDFPGS